MPRKSKRHPLYPEPGAWILDEVRGMPKLQQPEPLPRDGKLSSRAVRDEYVAYEGLGYCIFEYIPVAKLADPKLAQLWEAAQVAMRNIVAYLETAGETHQRRKLRTVS